MHFLNSVFEFLISEQDHKINFKVYQYTGYIFKTKLTKIKKIPKVILTNFLFYKIFVWVLLMNY